MERAAILRKSFLALAFPAIAAALALGASRATPAGCNEWTTNGPYGGSVFALAIDKQQPNILYAGIHGGGIYKTTDGGANWRAINTGLGTFSIRDLAVSPQDSSVVYAAVSGTDTAPLYKSTNAGESWEPSGNGITHGQTSCVEIDQINPNTLYAGGFRLFKSSDGGASWTVLWNDLVIGIVSIAISPLSPSLLYAASFAGPVLRTTDGGASWSTILDDLPFGYVTLALDQVSPNTLYVGTYGAGIWKSEDGGESWTNLDNLPPNITSVATDPLSERTVFAGTQGWGIFKSCDGGGSWEQINEGITDVFYPVKTFAFHPSQEGLLYAGIGGGFPESGGGVFKTLNGGNSWAPAIKGISNLTVGDVVADWAAPGVLYASCWDSGVFKSVDGGASWDLLESLPRYNGNYGLAMAPDNPLVVYSASSGGVYKTTDAGGTWEFLDTGFSRLFTCLEIDPSSPSVLYACSNYGVFKSMDGGLTWAQINRGMPESENLIRSVSIAQKEPSTLFAGGNWGLFKSTNAGGFWVPKPDGVEQFPPVAAVETHPSNAETIYVSAWDVYKSTDGGASLQMILEWEPVGGPKVLALDSTAPDMVYLGTVTRGAYKSCDAGLTWTPLSDGLPVGILGAGGPWTYRSIEAFAVDPHHPRTLHAAGWDGVHSIRQVPLPGDSDEDWTVSIGGVQKAINMLMGLQPPDCSVDSNGDGQIPIGEVQRVINGFLGMAEVCPDFLGD